jgi:hypothetical protein
LQGPYNEMEEDVTEYIHTYQRYSFKGKVAWDGFVDHWNL